jgi:hypothetical protein
MTTDVIDVDVDFDVDFDVAVVGFGPVGRT